MNTKSLNISFPEDLKTKAKQLAVEQKHGSVGRYIQYLLRREAEKDTERKKLKVLLQQGIDSGTSDTTPEEFFKQLRSNLK
ncbi:hypothetical protein GCM10011365_15950 [Marinicella pacifica]|uniref:Antitoxin ParD1/3/4 n=1 Tax=Marinicella pacifica TaxID=1171543 RepID=A0A917CPS1_9GAMM|nr:hypothetical protein [Marinicella pacifica]GGF95423.1 hypothetical protein GCM10011365_15950 [Marinicella pacifica]